MHTHPINSKADSARGGHTDLQCVKKILIGMVGFLVSACELFLLFGEPMYDNGDYFELEVTVSDAGYKGSFTIYFTDNADTAGASQIDLSLIEE